MEENLKPTIGEGVQPSGETLKKKYDNGNYIIIENEETLWKYTGRKIKKSWVNDRDKLKTITFILLKKLDTDPPKFQYVKIIDKKAQDEKLEEAVSTLFEKNCLVYLAYIDEKTIREKLSLKEQNFNF